MNCDISDHDFAESMACADSCGIPASIEHYRIKRTCTRQVHALWFNRADVVSMSLKLTFADMDLRVDVFILGMISVNIGRHTQDLCHDTVLSAPQRST